MKATNLSHISCSGYNPKEWEEIPEIKSCRPTKGFIEVSLQRIDTNKTINLVQWYGAKNGVWIPASDIFMITKK